MGKAAQTTEAPYGLRKDGTPRRKPGRSKGCKKPLGSGKQKEVCSWTSPEVREKLLPELAEKTLAILRGDKLLMSGPTGKDVYRRPSENLLAKTLETGWRKCLPDLASTTLQGPEGRDLIPQPEQHTPRQVARAVLAILSHAHVDTAITNSDGPVLDSATAVALEGEASRGRACSAGDDGARRAPRTSAAYHVNDKDVRKTSDGER